MSDVSEYSVPLTTDPSSLQPLYASTSPETRWRLLSRSCLLTNTSSSSKDSQCPSALESIVEVSFVILKSDLVPLILRWANEQTTIRDEREPPSGIVGVPAVRGTPPFRCTSSNGPCLSPPEINTTPKSSSFLARAKRKIRCVSSGDITNFFSLLLRNFHR